MLSYFLDQRNQYDNRRNDRDGGEDKTLGDWRSKPAGGGGGQFLRERGDFEVYILATLHD